MEYIELGQFLRINALLLSILSYLYHKVANENFTFPMKKSYHVMSTLYVGVITQRIYSGNQEGSTISPNFTNKIPQI